MKTDEFMKDVGTCGNCTKLKWNRKRLGLTQKQLADKVGVHVLTIGKLERDETAWGTLQASTVDKISEFYASMASWQPDRPDKVLREINEVIEEPPVEEEIVMEPKVVFTQKPIETNNGLNTHDSKTLTLMEFAYEGLVQATTHEEFAANIKMIKRIIDKY